MIRRLSIVLATAVLAGTPLAAQESYIATRYRVQADSLIRAATADSVWRGAWASNERITCRPRANDCT